MGSSRQHDGVRESPPYSSDAQIEEDGTPTVCNHFESFRAGNQAVWSQFHRTLLSWDSCSLAMLVNFQNLRHTLGLALSQSNSRSSLT